MSDDEQDVVRTEIATRMLTAEYKDGQLEIVEMTPYQKGHKVEGIAHVIAEGSESSNDGLKYMQVLDADKNVVVDLLNLTLVRCEDGQEAYRIVSNDTESGDDTTVTCVLSNEDSEEQDNQESYVVLDGEQGPMVFLQSSLPQTNQTVKVETKEKPKLTPTEILERAKALQKAKALMSAQSTKDRSRKRKNELPPPHELLASPQFKLFLYSCKLCTFKCNAIKELTAHKAEEHNGSATKWRGGGRAAASSLQCARCPYRGTTHTQLMKHVKEKHLDSVTTIEGRGAGRLLLESDEVREADVLVCGACGFESAARDVFRRHIEREHGVTPC
ncbi:uncharacterized protein LOC126779116 isoform X2 [Nymphalis io]|uniref:uncharacterized protein LOC126779116 isoform X2 n=1 Tax=Inachis io TaxID=171585 RepID=UPI002167558C|nr:uncharacterized protein LOC126779116 isoform X2 [Nymphalis io]